MNPGQLQWLQVLSDKPALAQQQQLLEAGEVTRSQSDMSSDSWDDSMYNRHGAGIGFGSVIDIAHLQQIAEAGGKLERLQVTPMQLADLVQQCAYTLDPRELTLTQQLLAAAAAASVSSSNGSSSRATSRFAAAAAVAAAAAAAAEDDHGVACCGLWPELSLVTRSCVPNVTITLLEEDVLVVRAAGQMPAGTEVCH